MTENNSDLLEAKVIRSHQREFDCKLINEDEIIKATALGNLLKKGDNLVVGDNVLVQKNEQTNEYVIKELIPRKNEIFRVLIRQSKKKVTAANIDYLIIICSSSRPKYVRGILERFLVRAYQWNVEPLVVFNKMDEYTGEDFSIEYEVERLSTLGLKCFEISALEADYQPEYLEKGLKELKAIVRDKTSIFVGKSGVGKSETISTLSEGKVNLLTKSVRKIGKGSHTTTWSELVDCEDFYLVDSPGIRSFSLDDIDPDELIHYFPDVEEIALRCEFSNCSHLPDNKGCKFYEEYDPDTDEGLMIHSRLESYLTLFDELSSTPFWEKKKKYTRN